MTDGPQEEDGISLAHCAILDGVGKEPGDYRDGGPVDVLSNLGGEPEQGTFDSGQA